MLTFSPKRDTMPEQDFSDLLARARQGDNVALTQLAEQYEDRIRSVAHGKICPAMRAWLDSMDLVQSVHRSLMVGLRGNKFSIRSPADLIALTVTMVKRKAARRWERVKRERDYLELQQLLTDRSRAVSDPTSHVERAEQIQVLLAELDDDDRRLLRLYLVGNSNVEAARILGLDADVLRVRRSRVFKKLRDGGFKIV